MAKAVVLFSGGLDSILACCLMLEQKIEVIALNFLNPFNPAPKKGERYQPQKMSQLLKIPLKIVPLGQDYINLIKNARYGYGAGMNPCLDCRIYTFTLARNFMEQIGADFVVTGEVLGERPMSQHRQAMDLIEKKSGLYGRLLRPLSARLLMPNVPELNGLVERYQLLAIQGRSRKPQLALAAKFGIRGYPNPAGGCLLTDKTFTPRLRDAFKHGEDSLREIKLLKIGRHFRLGSGKKVIVGRNEYENKIIKNLATASDILLQPLEIAGPTVIILKPESDEDLITAAGICARYSDGKKLPRVKIVYLNQIITVPPLNEEKLQTCRIN